MNLSSTKNRRQFLSAAGILTGASCVVSADRDVIAAEPFTRTNGPRFKVGLAAYSLRSYFAFMKGKEKKPADPDKAIDMIGFLDYCVAQNFDAAELTSYFFKPDADNAYYLDLRRQAFLKGMTISGTAIGNNFTRGAGDQLNREIDDAMAWIDRAAVLGAPHIRFFAGTGKELDNHPERFDDAVNAMKRCANHAASKGIFLGIENHGNLRADQLLRIIHAVDHPWVGINLDTGNFYTDDPYGDLEKCAPYAVNIQVKVSMKKPDRSEYPADMTRIGKLLKDAGYQGFVILEYENEDPFENIPRAHQELREALA